MSSSTEEEKLSIQLGDIIQIEAPDNRTLNGFTFYVTYIDANKIKLLHTATKEQIILNIINNSLSDESIQNIILLSRHDEKGYARQHNLLPNNWVDIIFNGDIPIAITGKITNLEEDMIEITYLPDKEIIYIDFAYQGIPEDIPISKIKIRDPPMQEVKDEEDVRKKLTHTTAATNVNVSDEYLDDDADVGEDNIAQPLNEILFDADQIEFGDKLEEITQLIEVPESEKRFSIDKQTEDILNNLLSSIPTVERNPRVLNNIKMMIERFKQLRIEYSHLNDDGSIEKHISNGYNHKPLVKTLQNMDQQLYWILPVVKAKKKMYDVESEDIEDINDIDPYTLAQARIAETNITNLYLSNDIPEGQNKYDFLFKTINPYLTPYTLFENQQLIMQKPVNTNMLAIVDNLEDMFSSVWPNKRRRYATLNHNVGLTKLRQEDSFTKSRIRVPLTSNDIISLKSILTLPESTLQFSHINLPETNILMRSNLNTHFLNYWQILKQKTLANTVVIDDIEKETDFENYLSSINEYILDERLIHDHSDKYFDLIIPKTRVLFDIIKKYITGKFTLQTIINYLQPFMIYAKDISYQQYTDITSFIEEKIKLLKKTYTLKLREYQTLGNHPYFPAPNTLTNLLNSDVTIQEAIMQEYDLANNPQLSDAEIYSHILKTDNGALFMSAISFINHGLNIPGKLEQILNLNDTLKKQNKEALSETKETDSCSQYVLAKKYIELDELEEDNNVEIYFDKNYDKTYYDIILEYDVQRASMSPEEFRLFLIQELKNKNGLSQSLAERDADAMIYGKRLVKEGDYAVLELEDEDLAEHKYYIRNDSQWILAENIDSNTFSDKNKFFCNFQNKCLSVDDTCKTENETINDANLFTVKTMIDEFNDELETNQQQTKELVEKTFTYNLQNIRRIKTVTMTVRLQTNAKCIEIGLNNNNTDNVIISPYAKLRDIILQQTDFIKKQSDIVLFVNKFTRTFIKSEDPYWLYCNNTNTKLLPTFIYKLANCFVTKNNYIQELKRICTNQGALSDDGDSWVDKYSGYVIKKIDFDTDEGYTDDGFKDKGRDIIEEDLGNIILKPKYKKQTFTDPNTNIISNIIASLAQFMGINLDSQTDFIIENSLKIFKKSIPSEMEYNNIIKAAADKGKKPPPDYEHFINSSLIYITAAHYLIGIQISIPPIKTQKTFPNCIKSFDGFPLQGIEDRSGLIYIACVIHKIKNSTAPWNSLSRIGQKSIAKKIENIITTYIITNNNIMDKLQEKVEYLNQSSDEIIHTQHGMIEWKSFLPPLFSFKLRNIHNINAQFEQSLINNIRKGANVQQNEQLAMISNKIRHYSLTIQGMIQNIIKTESSILRNSMEEPFLENSCCNARQDGTIYYFINKDSHILTTNNIVRELEVMQNRYQSITNPPFIVDYSNTKYAYPQPANYFSEETIYRAFIYYCNYSNSKPISENLSAICTGKPAEFDNNIDIKKQIEGLKREGKQFSNLALQQLITVINKQNMVNMPLNNDQFTVIQDLREYTQYLMRHPDEIISDKICEYLNNILDTFEIASIEENPDIRSLKNLLARQNSLLLENITNFISNHTKLSKNKVRHMSDEMQNIFVMQQTGDEFIYLKETETVYKSINYIKNSIHTIINLIPNNIIHKNEFKNVNLPSHWNLSERHNLDIINIIKKYYEPLYSFYNDSQIAYLCEIFKTKCANIFKLSQKTIFISNIYKNNQVIHSILDARTSELLFSHYLYRILNVLIELTQNKDIIQTDRDVKQGEELKIEDDYLELEMIQGDKKALSQKIAALLVVCIKTILNNKSIVDTTYDSIMDKILHAKEKEKEHITNYLQNLTDEERNIETAFKNHKLEKWGVGLQKGLTQYDKETYDNEREQMEKQALTDYKLSNNSQVTDMNHNIYALDLDENARMTEEIEKEAYDMSEIPDDDDDGDY